MKKSRIFWIIASVLVMILIFYFSSQDAQSSSGQSGFLISLLHLEALGERASFVVRKSAHFTIFGILGLCLFFAWKSDRQNPWISTLLALATSFVYAASDEWHQTFLPGRSGQFSDVMLDTCGAFVGIMLALGIYYIIHTRSSTA